MEFMGFIRFMEARWIFGICLAHQHLGKREWAADLQEGFSSRISSASRSASWSVNSNRKVTGLWFQIAASAEFSRFQWLRRNSRTLPLPMIANWFTYQTNHYFLARAMMNANLDPAQVLRDYARKRFGPAWAPMGKYFQILEVTTPQICSIPGSTVQSEDEVQQGMDRLNEARQLLDKADQKAEGNAGVKLLISRLQSSLDYTMTDVRIRLTSWKVARGGGWADSARCLAPLIHRLRAIFLAHQGEGIFLIPSAYTDYVGGKR